MQTGFRWESREKKDYQEDLKVGGRIILRKSLEKLDGVVKTDFIWLRIGTSGRFL
jgi:hypothetical protein